ATSCRDFAYFEAIGPGGPGAFGDAELSVAAFHYWHYQLVRTHSGQYRKGFQSQRRIRHDRAGFTARRLYYLFTLESPLSRRPIHCLVPADGSAAISQWAVQG